MDGKDTEVGTDLELHRFFGLEVLSLSRDVRKGGIVGEEFGFLVGAQDGNKLLPLLVRELGRFSVLLSVRGNSAWYPTDSFSLYVLVELHTS